MRLCTARTAENNKNTLLRYANRVSDVAERNSYGDEYFEYGEVECLEVCLMPFKTEVEAKAYGVSLLGGKKATLTVEEGKLFNEFTHIWVEAEPDDDLQNSDYIVKDISTTLNGSVLILEKKDG